MGIEIVLLVPDMYPVNADIYPQNFRMDEIPDNNPLINTYPYLP
jgi:hypothetical protein